jgi:hypothetical protein
MVMFNGQRWQNSVGIKLHTNWELTWSYSMVSGGTIGQDKITYLLRIDMVIFNGQGWQNNSGVKSQTLWGIDMVIFNGQWWQNSLGMKSHTNWE